MQHKYSEDIAYYQEKVDKNKNRVGKAKQELEKLRSKLSKHQDFKQEIIKDIEDNEEKLREA
mgnify:CR=1 FL=1